MVTQSFLRLMIHRTIAHAFTFHHIFVHCKVLVDFNENRCSIEIEAESLKINKKKIEQEKNIKETVVVSIQKLLQQRTKGLEID